MSETELSRAILKAVNLLPNVRLWRQPAGGYRGRSVGVPKGTPDLVGYVGRYFIGLEIKGKDRLKDRTSVTYLAQLAWREGAWEDGAAAYVVSSVREAVETVQELRKRGASATPFQ